MGSGRRERLNEAHARFEAAEKAGDALGADMADAEVTAILDEGRAARAAASAQQAPAEPQLSFDGGVRRSPGPREKPGLRDPLALSPAALFAAAFQASARHSKNRVRI